MIDFPPDYFFEKTLKPGKVYYYISQKTKTPKRRFYIIVTVLDAGTIILCTTTTQIEKRIKYIEYNKHPSSTLVFIKTDEDNGLTEESVVDCNYYEHEDKESLKKIFTEKGIEFKGNLKESKLEEIRKGLIDSPVVEEEIKDVVKKI